MVKFLIPAALVVVLGIAGYMIFGQGRQAYAPDGTPRASEYKTESLPTTGNSNIDDVISALEDETSAEQSVAGEADADASVVTSDTEDLDNLDQSYDQEF